MHQTIGYCTKTKQRLRSAKNLKFLGVDKEMSPKLVESDLDMHLFSEKLQ